MPIAQSFSSLETSTVTDQVFQSLYTAIMTLELPPGSKISEADVAKNLGVSRQPVRDTFYRLSNLGFLNIRPQRATTISLISEKRLKDALFARTALEVECLRAAIEKSTEADIQRLEAVTEKQRVAVKLGERLTFYALDNEFHRTICEVAGHASMWGLIRDQKIHTERVCYLSLQEGAHNLYEEHRVILQCIKERDSAHAELALRSHLSGVLEIVEQVSASKSEYFCDG